MAYTQVIIPAGGEKITINGSPKAAGKLQIPDAPIIPYVEATGPVGISGVLR